MNICGSATRAATCEKAARETGAVKASAAAKTASRAVTAAEGAERAVRCGPIPGARCEAERVMVRAEATRARRTAQH